MSLRSDFDMQTLDSSKTYLLVAAMNPVTA